MIYNKDGVTFNSVKLPLTLFNEGPLGIKFSEEGNNSEGQKGIKYTGNNIENIIPFINAVDIDWNEVSWEDIDTSNIPDSINNTADLLKIIKHNIENNKLLFKTINGESIIGTGNIEIKDDSSDDSDEYCDCRDGLSAYEIYCNIQRELGKTPKSLEAWIQSLNPDILVGTVETVESNVPANVEIVKDNNGKFILNFTIPKGVTGDPASVIIRDGDGEGENININVPIQHIKVNGEEIFPENYTVNITIPEGITSNGSEGLKISDITLLRRPGYPNELKVHSGGNIYPITSNIQPNWIETNTNHPSYIRNKPDEIKYMNVWAKGSRFTSDGTEYISLDSVRRVITGKQGETEETVTNVFTGEPKFIGNEVFGSHSIATGWSCVIGNNLNSDLGNFSFAEGKATTVEGNYSHVSGCLTTVSGNYSYGGGLDDGNVASQDYHSEDIDLEAAKGYNIKGNYSFGYGKNIITNNNGEVAFGKYNDSQTISSLAIPSSTAEENIAYDRFGKLWKIIDFWRVDIDNFSEPSESVSGNWASRMFEFNYNNEDSEDSEDLEDSEDFSHFIYNIFSHKCNIVTRNARYWTYLNLGEGEALPKGEIDDNVQTYIENFLEDILYNINLYKENYIYNWNLNGYLGHGIESKCVIGVIAQKFDENNNEFVDEYDFFIWGPDYLYYPLSKPLTVFSIGNGDWYLRNNLIEITSDGNIHYKNGTKSLSDLELDITTILNALNLNIELTRNIGTDVEDTSNYYTKTIDINLNTPSTLVFNDIQYDFNDSINGVTSIKNRSYILNIELEEEESYYKKTFIIDLDTFTTSLPLPKLEFATNIDNLILSFNIQSSNNVILDLDSNSNNNYITLANPSLNDSKIFKIDLELIGKNCLIDVKEYTKSPQ